MPKSQDEASLLSPFSPGRPSEEATAAISQQTLEDLQCDQLCTAVEAGEMRAVFREVIRHLPRDPQLIRYRQAVFSDLLDNPQFTEALTALLPQLEELVSFRGLSRNQGFPFLESVWRLGELELYLSVTERLAELLNDEAYRLRSEGFARLRRRLEEERNDPHYRSLRSRLPELSRGIREKNSLTIGVNLDHYLRPVEAGIVRINARRFGPRDLISRIFGDQHEFSTLTPLHHTPSHDGEGNKLPLAPLFQDLEALIKSSARKLLQPLRDFHHLQTGFLSSFRRDILFYLAGLQLHRRLREEGMALSLPEILPPQQRELHAEGLYNPLLLLREESEADHRTPAKGAGERVVTNAIDFDDEGRIFVLTGANRGGKTTFTVAIGLCHLLGQAGLAVPAEQCSLSPAEHILSHFPQREGEQADTGRLGEEADRLARLFEVLTPGSLLLLNESLTSTNPAEGIYLAGDLLRALRLAGVRALFSTHFHQLAAAAADINREVEGNSRVDTLVAEALPAEELERETGSASPQARRTFRILRRQPDGSSYAHDIARSFGIDYEQLRQRLRERGIV